MSEINSINGGYKGGSPRVRSENSRKITPKPPQPIDVQDMVTQIHQWYLDGRLSTTNIQYIISELNKI